ncbi:PAS domain-containing protein [Paenibacillus pinistramenti]|uniref:PAS domain-containing protein n=1 Tax=Paenibacillus pinistramenti TaxID=1768003 RepID=UPI001109A8BC|nr:PAS domain-containing sensor histidine kinase [Paenibacillus pinistramenti]
MTTNNKTLAPDGEQRPDSVFGTAAGAALMDSQGILIKINPALCRFLGYEEHELLGEPAYQFIHPEDVLAVQKDFRSWAAEDSDPMQIESRYLHKQGHIIRGLARLSKMPVMDPFLVVIHLTNMTIEGPDERDKTGWEFRNALYHLNSDAAAVFSLEGRVLKLNAAFEKMFGYQESEVIGDFLPAFPLPKLQEILSSFNEQGEKISSGQKLEYETIQRTKDGKLISVFIKHFPICGDSGRMEALGAILKDITEKGALTSQFHDLFAFNLDPILIFDRGGYVIQANRSFTDLLGWPLLQVLDCHWSRLPCIRADQEADLRQLADKVIREHTVTGFETIFMKEDGTPVHISLTSFPLKYGRNETGGMALFFRDITPIRKAEQLMMESEKLSLTGQLAAAVAHEIRNPITSIKGFLKLLQNSERKQQYFEIVNTEIDRIELILNEMLALAKPQLSKFESKNIRLLLDQVVSLLGGEANMNSIEICLQDFTVTESPEVLCDENQIKQVFINFIKNAIEAMPDGGTLTISLHPPDSVHSRGLRILFTDTGTGIPPELLEKIGEPFFTTKDSGTGLGFMTSRNIIEQHKGKLGITSRVDEGTTIEIELPAGSALERY